MHGCAFLLMLFLAAPVGTASAQQATGFYVSAYTGYVAPQDMKWDVTTAGVSFDVATDSTGILGFKLGWVPPAAKYLALEMDFNYIFESNYGPTTVSGVTGEVVREQTEQAVEDHPVASGRREDDSRFEKVSGYISSAPRPAQPPDGFQHGAPCASRGISAAFPRQSRLKSAMQPH